MPHEVHWRLMFRTNDAAAADRCLRRALVVISANVVIPPKLYWKLPELWEVSLRSPFASSTADGVLSLLAAADRLATGWHISGPCLANGQITMFDGVFDIRSGRAHVAGLAWASFSVSQQPPVVDPE